MTLAHARTSSNRTLISQYVDIYLYILYCSMLTVFQYALLREWADYLVENALTPNDQLSPDMATISTNNQTNVALKGILGIAAMGKLSAYASLDGDESKYTVSLVWYAKGDYALSVSDAY